MFNLGSSAVVHAQIRHAHFTEGFSMMPLLLLPDYEQ